MSKINFATCYPMQKNAAKTAILSVLSQTFQNDMFLPKYIFDIFVLFHIFCIFGSAGRAEPFKFTSGDGTSIDDV